MERIVKLADIDAMTANYNEVKAGMNEVKASLKKGVLSYNPDTDYFGMEVDGVWKDVVFAGFKTYWLYHEGDEMMDVTGGWALQTPTSGTNFAGSGTTIFTKGEDCIHVSVSGTAYQGGVILAPNNSTSLANFSKICFDVTILSASGTSYLDLGCGSKYYHAGQGDYVGYRAMTAASFTPGRNVYEVDITGDSANKFVYIAVWFSSSGTNKAEFDLHNIWLE